MVQNNFFLKTEKKTFENRVGEILFEIFDKIRFFLYNFIRKQDAQNLNCVQNR